MWVTSNRSTLRVISIQKHKMNSIIFKAFLCLLAKTTLMMSLATWKNLFKWQTMVVKGAIFPTIRQIMNFLAYVKKILMTIKWQLNWQIRTNSRTFSIQRKCETNLGTYHQKKITKHHKIHNSNIRSPPTKSHPGSANPNLSQLKRRLKMNKWTSSNLRTNRQTLRINEVLNREMNRRLRKI